MKLKRVFLISPYSGEVDKNVAFARHCMDNCFARGEAPFAGHLLYTQCLDDCDARERRLGIEAGQLWMDVCDTAAVYLDRGCSKGMIDDINHFLATSSLFFGSTRSIKYRFLEPSVEASDEWLHAHNVPHPKCGLCVLFPQKQ